MTVGIRVGSRYVATDMIGRGSFGTVFRGEGPSGPVAIKLLRPDLATDPETVDRFLRERSVLLRLRHPNLVSVRDLVAESDLLALVMDLIDGPDLRTVLRRDGPLPVPEACRLVAGVADALAQAHAAGVVHRDLKPENVLLDTAPADPSGRTGSGSFVGTDRPGGTGSFVGTGPPGATGSPGDAGPTGGAGSPGHPGSPGGTGSPGRTGSLGRVGSSGGDGPDAGAVPRLTDFGIARLVAAATSTGPQTVVGTPGYLAPEVARGAPATPAADVYAAGVLLYELIAGRPPFSGEHALAVIHRQLTEVPERPPGMPDDIAAVLGACLSRDPSGRPTAPELAGALRGRPPLGPQGTQLVPLARSTGYAAVSAPGPPEAEGRAAGPVGHGWPLRIASLLVVAVLGVAGGYALRTATARDRTPSPGSTHRASPAPTAIRRYAADMPYTQVNNGWGPVERNRSVGGQGPDDGGPLVLGGTTYPRGLGVNAPSQVRLYPGGACTQFTAMIGVDATAAANSAGTVSFQLSGDGKPLYDSGIVTWQTPPKPVSVDLTGVQVLDLVVTDGGDGNAYDAADWADAALQCRP